MSNFGTFLKRAGKAIVKGIKKTGQFALRYGPLVAAAGVGLQSIPQVAEYARWLSVALGIFGVESTPELSEPVGVFITQLVLLIGSFRKVASIVRKKM